MVERAAVNRDVVGSSPTSGANFLNWKPDSVLLVLGAAYVGHMDDLAVFSRALTDAEVKQLFALKDGVAELHP